MFLRCALGLSFITVLVTGLAECHRVAKNWQVTPEPGGQCRQGFVQLITIGTARTATDIILSVFPVPTILYTHIPTKRKACW